MKNKILIMDNIKLKLLSITLIFQIILSAGLLFIFSADIFGKEDRLLYCVIFAALIVLANAAAIVFAAGSISSSISKAADLIENFSQEGSDYEADIKSHGVTGKIFKAIEFLKGGLKNEMSKVSETGLQINSNVSEISSVIAEQNSILETQSDSMAQITTTVEELSASSKQISTYSDQVFEIAEHGLDNAEHGVSSIEKTMNEMRSIIEDSQHKLTDIVELGKKSQEISSVMGIINSIADQTKLIAFNAALEASSAGEAGKRFGVVAVEIRRLADNVMESTGEIETKISEIQDSINTLTMASEKSSVEMEKGMSATSQTMDILKDILEGAKTNRDAAKQISISTKQQETASEQVVLTLRDIIDGSEQNTDSVERAINMTRNLSDLSSQLKMMVGKFKAE